MASTYSNLKIQLMTTGENSTTWGAITNTNLGTAIEEAIVGSADVTFASANTSITLSNSNSTQAARNMRLNLTGTTGGATRTLTVPDIEKVYIVNNGCADAVEIKNSTGSNVSVPAGTSTWVYSTGSNVVDVVTSLTSLKVGGSDVVTESATQTLTNKTLTAPAVTNLTGSLASTATATTQSVSDDSTKIATTAFVKDALTDFAGTSVKIQFGGLGVGTAASATTGEIRATNDITAFYSSDRRYKENVQPIQNALDTATAIGGKTFDWSEDYIAERGGEDGYFVKKQDFGVIAQDVQKVFPLAVRERENGMLAVDYEKLSALALAAIAELKNEVDKLKRGIDV